MKRSSSALILGATLALAACGPAQTDEQTLFRVAVAKFQHETCTFCPGGDVEVEDWQEVLSGPDVLDSGSYVRGFVRQAEDYGDMALVPLTSPNNVFGGSSRSWNTEETFEHFMEGILSDLRAAMPVDGVYLALHGAMAVRDVPRPEAEIARRVREVCPSRARSTSTATRTPSSWNTPNSPS
jgi:microcystin degradation protein MlrC